MNAYDLMMLLKSIENRGFNLHDIPLFFVENHNTIALTHDYVKIINSVKKFNEEQTLQLITQFDQCLLIGPVVECDDN